MRLLQIGNNFIALLFVSLGFFAFFMTTLEEYYLGTLYLPPCNAVSDGSIIIIVGFLTAGFTGNNVFLIPSASAEWMGIEGVESFTLG